MLPQLAVQLDRNRCSRGILLTKPWEQEHSDSQQAKFYRQQIKGWGAAKRVRQLSQQAASSSVYVGLFSCKLSALQTLLSEFSQLPGAGRRQRLLEMRKQAWQQDDRHV